MKLKLIFISLLALTFVCCGDDDDNMMTDDCDTSGITYTNTVASIINGSCSIPGCHVPNSSTFSMIDYNATFIAAGFGSMVGALNHEPGFTPMPNPPGSPRIAQCDIDKIEAWIADGAPE